MDDVSGDGERVSANGADADSDGDELRPDADEAGDRRPDTDGERIEIRSGPRQRREVIVPLRLYKTVTVFSTLLAVVFVVIGFGFVDAATVRGSPLVALVTWLPGTISLPVDDGTVSALLALVGVASIAAGAGIYVLGARFRTAGMEKGKGDVDEPDTDG